MIYQFLRCAGMQTQTQARRVFAREPELEARVCRYCGITNRRVKEGNRIKAMRDRFGALAFSSTRGIGRLKFIVTTTAASRWRFLQLPPLQ